MYFNLEPANGYLTYHVTYTCIYWCTVFVPRVGDMREEDMVVLLSERAAREIYKKWVDTLKVSSILCVSVCVCVCVCVYTCTVYVHVCVITMAVLCFNQFQAKKIGYQFHYRTQRESNAISGKSNYMYMYHCSPRTPG